MKKIFLQTLLLLLLLNSCKEKVTNPPDNQFPEGYQQDVPWPSLADSPWPMNHHDPQNTGRSKYVGAGLGTIDWKLAITNIQTGAVLSNDSTIFFASGGEPEGLCAVKSNGILDWNLPIAEGNKEILSTPLVSRDGTIYIPNGSSGKLFAINPNRTKKWEYQADNSIWMIGLNIGLDGTIYFIDAGGTLYAVNKNGTLEWKLTNSDFNATYSAAISFSPDGKTLYIPGVRVTLFAVDLESKIVKWTFGNSKLNASPVVDATGNIYVNSLVNNTTAALYSLKPDGSIRWSFHHNNSVLVQFGANPTIDKNGNIFICYDTLYSINYRGKLKWKISANGISESPLICDREGNIYVSTTDWTDGKLIKVSSNGSMIWEVDFAFPNGFGFAPAITKDEKLILPAWRGTQLYSIK